MIIDKLITINTDPLSNIICIELVTFVHSEKNLIELIKFLLVQKYYFVIILRKKCFVDLTKLSHGLKKIHWLVKFD